MTIIKNQKGFLMPMTIIIMAVLVILSGYCQVIVGNIYFFFPTYKLFKDFYY